MPGHCLDGESGEGAEAGESDEDPESVQGNDGDSGWYSTELLSAGEALHRAAESPLHPAAGIPGAGSVHTTQIETQCSSSQLGNLLMMVRASLSN